MEKNLLDDPGRVRSQITIAVCQIQRFDFGCNLVVMGKIIIRIPPPLRLKPLYNSNNGFFQNINTLYRDFAV
jgi:hypothetical protein